MKKLVVLPIHGMGDTPSNFAENLQKNLSEKLGTSAWNQIAFEPVYYQGVIQDNQDKVWKKMKESHSPIDWLKLRKFMLFSFSDAATLEHHSDHPESAYLKAQSLIRDILLGLLNSGITPDTPVALLPHSLGGQVMSNYIWDSKRDQGIWKAAPLDLPVEQLDFLKLKTLRLIASAGCNIPLFVAGLDDIVPIDKPHPDFIWENYYDPDDALGWPLKPLSPQYNDLVLVDHQINSGGFFTSWTPFSHNKYWDDKDFLNPVSQRIKNLVQ